MKKNFRYIFIFILFVTAVLSWRVAFGIQDGKLKFYILDVGQGDSIFIQTKNGNQMLIDGGPGKEVLSELGEVMPFYDRSIDIVLMTHPNLDHIAGLVDVLKNYDVKYFIDTDDPYSIAEYEELKRIIKEKNIKRIIARRGERIYLDEKTELLILSPEILDPKNPNSNSIVAKLSFGKVDFLLTGDAEKGQELSLVASGDNLESEVLKVGHHGSKTSSNPLFLEKVRPQYTLISVGAKNRYGHPTNEVLGYLAAVGAKILRTDIDSRIEIDTDGETLTLVSPRAKK